MGLSSESIASIRNLLFSCSRNEIKQFLLEAGAKAERILPIPVISNIKSKDYLSKSSLISLIFDPIYSDYEKEKADQVLLRLIKILHDHGLNLFDLKEKIKQDGINIDKLLLSKSNEHVILSQMIRN